MDVVAYQNVPLFLFLYPQDFLIPESRRCVVATNTSEGILTPQDPYIEEHRILTLMAETSALVFNFLIFAIDIFKRKSKDTLDRRSHRYAFQARLGNRLDPIKRKLLDNNMLLSSHPTDMLRISVVRDQKTQDIKMRSVESEEILPIILPTMKDIPMRRLDINETGTQILSLAATDIENAKPFDLYCPIGAQLARDDLLFRIIKDPHIERPYVMVLQIKEELATLSYSSLLYVKYHATIYDEKIPAKIINRVVEVTRKREALKW